MSVLIEGYDLSPQQSTPLMLGKGRLPKGFLTCGLIRIRGRVEETRLRNALTRVVSDHEILRTRFQTMPGMTLPVQTIPEPGEIHWETLDLTARLPHERESTLDRLRRERLPDLDLARDELLRCTLCRLEEEAYCLVIAMPCLIADAASLGLLTKALVRAYAAATAPSAQSEPMQYADYAAWQNELLAKGEGERPAFWTEPNRAQRITRIPPAARSRWSGTETGFQPEWIHWKWERNRQLKLTRVAGQLNSDPRTLAHGIWLLMMGKWVDSDELLTAMDLDGRTYEELKDALGPLTRALPIRVFPASASTLSPLLRGLAEAVGEASNCQEYFDRIAFFSEADPGVSDYFPIAFAFHQQDPPVEADDLQCLLASTHHLADRSDLKLCIGWSETPELALCFDRNRLSATEAARIADRYEALVEAILLDPQKNLDQYPILGAEERRLLLTGFHGPALEITTTFILDHIQAREARSPDQIALVFENQRLSYAALCQRVRGMARYLRSLGVRPETPVGLWAERSLEMVSGCLGILLAGGVHTPLDPDLPLERGRALLAQCGARLVVTDRSSEALPTSIRRVPLRPSAQAFPLEKDPLPSLGLDPHHAAYVMCTSGSTGTPKGVIVTHANLNHYTEAIGLALQPRVGARYATVSTMAADLGHTVIFGSLALGGTLHVLPETMVLNTEVMAARLAREPVDYLKIVPSHLKALAETAFLKALLPRIALILGGEKLEPALANAILASGRCRLFNHYGPTETTVGVSIHEIGERVMSPSVPIGLPLANNRTYPLDVRGFPRAFGQTGELFIGGPQLARGYLGDPRTTAQRFGPDPYSEKPGARLYASGDLAARGHDGKILILGRVDNQMKIRGYRVEPGEIEAVLRRRLEVAEAVVALRPDEKGEPSINAYLVAGDRPFHEENARKALAEHLPAYMIPQSFTLLAALPLTPNGKVDWSALPAPRAAPARFLAPRNPLEEVLIGIWEEILDREPLGILDDFFARGGHSLLAAQAIARIHEVFRVKVPLPVLFDAPTVAAFAPHLQRALGSEPAREIPPLVSEDAAGPLPLSFSQERMWLLHQLAPDSAAYHIPLVLRLGGLLSVGALEGSLRALVQRHNGFRTRFPERDGKPMQWIAADPFPELEILDLSSLRDAALNLEERVTQAAMKPFDLIGGWAYRIRLWRLSAREHVLLLCMHHIIGDFWSRRLIFEELAGQYQAFRDGKVSERKKLALQYADFAVWQRETLRGSRLAEGLAYWRERLAGIEPLELPLDRQRPKVQTSRGASIGFFFPGDTWDSVSAFSRQESVTPFMTLLAVFQLLLHRYSGQEDIAVGAPVANRDHVATQSMIGFFVNTLVLRTRLSPNLCFRDLVGRVREICLEAYAHQDLPFEKLVEDLNPVRGTERPPFFQVMFQLQNSMPAGVRLPELALDPFPMEVQTAKFEISLGLAETEEGARGWIEYNTDLFEKETISGMLSHYRYLLRGLLAQPEQRISSATLAEAERLQTLLHLWCGERSDGVLRQDVVAPFEARAETTPDRIAVLQGAHAISYGALRGRANALAKELAARGVGAESVIGLWLKRSPQLVEGLLAALSLGTAYLPLDPEYPSERLRLMAEDAGISLVLAQRGSRPEWISTSPILEITERAVSQGEPRARKPIHSSQTAYMIYTSGSTGRPKGVAVSHGSLGLHLDSIQTHFRIESADRFLHFASPNFDAAIEQFLLPLDQGACSILRDEEPPTASELAHDIEARALTVVNLPTGYWSLLTRDWARGDWQPSRRLRIMISGGDVVTPEMVAAWRKTPFRNASLLNAYGPTEATITSSVFRVPTHIRADQTPPRTVPIGKPVTNHFIYLLDSYLRPVPARVPGEIHIGGSVLARGYHGMPRLTAERFLPDPFSALAGARLYRSGDLARWLEKDILEFLGRDDAQIKLRGYRVEPGELEAVLERHPAVRRALVDVRGHGEDRRLAAYLVAKDQEPDQAEIRAHIQRHLPRFMHAAEILFLKAIPLTPNGKIDRRSLPEPAPSRSGTSYQAPQMGLEADIAAVWREILNLERVDREDNFFELGGNSLKMVALRAGLQQRMGRDFRLIELFEYPTIAALADHLGGARDELAELRADADRAASRRARLSGRVRAKKSRERAVQL